MRPKRHLEYYSKLYPSAWKQVDQFRAGRGKALPFWPDWCFMPLSGAYAIVSMEAEAQGIDITSEQGLPLANDVGIIGALAAWRVTQGVYRFDPDVYRAVIDAPITGDLPHNVLFNLPEWCVYIETPDLQFFNLRLSGFFAYLEYDPGNARKELRFVLDCATPEPVLISTMLHLGPWSLLKSVERMKQEEARQAERFGLPTHPASPKLHKTLESGFSPLVSLLLYICTVNGEIGEGDRKPTKPRAKKTKKGYRMFPAPKVSVWDVGIRMGAALRKAAQDDSTGESVERQRSGPRPHVRRAHWHGYWTGPREGERKFVLKWLSPILVGDNSNNMPVTIRPVK